MANDNSEAKAEIASILGGLRSSSESIEEPVMVAIRDFINLVNDEFPEVRMMLRQSRRPNEHYHITVHPSLRPIQRTPILGFRFAPEGVIVSGLGEEPRSVDGSVQLWGLLLALIKDAQFQGTLLHLAAWNREEAPGVLHTIGPSTLDREQDIEVAVVSSELKRLSETQIYANVEPFIEVRLSEGQTLQGRYEVALKNLYFTCEGFAVRIISHELVSPNMVRLRGQRLADE